jgi:hypothetical protein
MPNQSLDSIKDRIKTANRVVQTLGKGFLFSYQPKSGLYFEWISPTHTDQLIRKRWTASSFYPSFHKQLGCGSTSLNAITQLARYCQSKPHLPLSAWSHWAGDNVMLWRDKEVGQKMIGILKASSYNDPQPCVLCGELIKGKWEWGLSLNGKNEGMRHRGSKDNPYPCRNTVI